MKMLKKLKTPEGVISCLGLAALAAAFICWRAKTPSAGAAGTAAALTSAALFAAVCLRFVPEWTVFWGVGQPLRSMPAPDAGDEPRHMCLRIFFALLAADALLIVLVFLLRRALGDERGFYDALSFWRCTDSTHYLDIARDWYLSEGSFDRLVQLVFLPGYPIAVRAATLLLGDELIAGLTVSAVSFAGAGCVFYRLMRLDYSHEYALRAVKLLCLMPGSFFFAAPMSESLFILLCAGCVYLVRKQRRVPGCLLGALAAFTRSLGIMLLAPVVFELVRRLRKRGRVGLGQTVRQLLPALLIPAGFGVYLVINYLVSGDFFKFMQYQHEHWGQGFGWFFATASYQTRLAIDSFSSDTSTFLGLWLPNLLAAFGSLGVMLFAARRLRPGYTAWFIAYFFVAIGATWLLSAPRYMLACLPVTMGLAAVTGSDRADTAITLTLGVLNVLYLFAFILRWQVW